MADGFDECRKKRLVSTPRLCICVRDRVCVCPPSSDMALILMLIILTY